MGYPPWLWKAPNFSLPFHCRHMPPVGADGVEEWVQQQWDLRLPEKLPASWARWFLRDWCIHIYIYVYIYNVQYCGKLKIKGNPFALCLKVYWSKKILNVVWLFVGFAGLMCFFLFFSQITTNCLSIVESTKSTVMPMQRTKGWDQLLSRFSQNMPAFLWVILCYTYPIYCDGLILRTSIFLPKFRNLLLEHQNYHT